MSVSTIAPYLFCKSLTICQRQNSKSNTVVQEYLLPNFTDNRQGRVRAPDEELADSDQVLVMNNERFAVPELLFRPMDIGNRALPPLNFCDR